ncbi:MAG TPA: glycosyltransferase [Pyrinomonadaceae bacterium]|nr:glycosyltransferase [Pyrinomonadaceae bacterium]
MRIYLSSGHRYPAWRYGVAAHAIHDRLARGLAELGHEVRYHLEDFGEEKLPEGVIPVRALKGDEDIIHSIRFTAAEVPQAQLPWVRSVHSDLLDQGFPRERSRPNFIFVSETMARLHGSDRFVWNGIDPTDFIYSETKDNYFLFVVAGDVDKARSRKGLDIAFWIARQTGIKLVVAGGTENSWENEVFEKLCRENDADFIGLIHGEQKAEKFAAAKALLFPTQMNEAFGLPVAEALMSGTPVIASDRGAMTEVLDLAGGFTCADESEYLNAVANLGQIKSSDCRQLALSRFHYLDMARNYVKEYERERSSHKEAQKAQKISSL